MISGKGFSEEDIIQVYLSDKNERKLIGTSKGKEDFNIWKDAFMLRLFDSNDLELSVYRTFVNAEGALESQLIKSLNLCL